MCVNMLLCVLVFVRIFMCVCVVICVYLSLCACFLCKYVYVSVCLCMCAYVFSLCAYLSVSTYVSLCACVCVSLSACVSVYKRNLLNLGSRKIQDWDPHCRHPYYSYRYPARERVESSISALR